MLTREARYLEKIRALDAWALEQTVPGLFDSGHPENVLTTARQRFIKLCAALTEQGFAAPAQLSLVAFHAAIDHVSAKYDKG